MNTQLIHVSPLFYRLADFARGKPVSPGQLAALQQSGLIFPDNDGALKVTRAGEQTLEENPGL